MGADTFLQILTQGLFVLIFVLVAAEAVVRPRRASVDAALLFGAIAIIVVEAWLSDWLHLANTTLLRVLVSSLLMALPYLLLRLVDDFAGVPRGLLRSAEAGLALSILTLVIWSGPHLPGLLVLLLVGYFVALAGYVTVAVTRAARYTSGITRRRMRAVALGTLCLGLVIALAGARALFPHTPAGVWVAIADSLSLGCGVCYFVGFAPPAWLRRTWQEPELRAFLGRAASLPRLPSTAAIVRELEYGAASSLGLGHAVIGLWNASAGALERVTESGGADRWPLDTFSRRAFEKQQAVFSDNARRDNPDEAAIYRMHGVNSVLAVPITAGSRRLGVLAVYAARAPIFAEDDLKLSQLLADQAAVILESRALIDEAARVQAREEATRLKDDFLSAAAHDLKTPLTALIAQAQLLQYRARRKPDAPMDQAGIERMVRESQRLKRLVTELLDVGRVERGQLVDKCEEVDLTAMVREVCTRHSTARHPCRIDAQESMTGRYDPVRIGQLIENLLENAVKYSPDGGEVRVTLRHEGGNVHLEVTDQGIGIPVDDLPHLFDRFHRGTNVDDRRFSGMGLGLYICRGIAEQHGGRLWATSQGANRGSTFHVVLPAELVASPASAPISNVSSENHEAASLRLVPGESS